MARTSVLAPPAMRPILIGPFTLTSTGLDIRGRPTFEEYQGVGTFIQRAHQASGFWMADWLRYGEAREDWQDRLDQAVESTGLSEKTLANVRAIGAIDKSRRRDGVEFALHGEVAGLTPDEQSYWLERAEGEGWTRAELRGAIQAGKRATQAEGRAATMHTVDVTVRVEIESTNAVRAQDAAWAMIKRALADTVVGAKVIAAHTQPR